MAADLQCFIDRQQLSAMAVRRENALIYVRAHNGPLVNSDRRPATGCGEQTLRTMVGHEPLRASDLNIAPTNSTKATARIYRRHLDASRGRCGSPTTRQRSSSMLACAAIGTCAQGGAEDSYQRVTKQTHNRPNSRRPRHFHHRSRIDPHSDVSTVRYAGARTLEPTLTRRGPIFGVWSMGRVTDDCGGEGVTRYAAAGS
jgi:hypothetical protein